MAELWATIKAWLIEVIHTLFAWLSDLIEWLAKTIYAAVMEALGQVISAIPMPSWYTNVGTFDLPSGVTFFLSSFAVPFGASVVASAYGIRFLIRRLPIIG